ncbi:MAG: S41 family peptidase [Planctomycetaceae bacterium]
MQVHEVDDGIELYSADDAEVNWVKPLVVICDRNSKLPAEVFAGAIKDCRRGIIVGDTTSRGNGTVQNVIDVRDGFSLFTKVDRGALKLTIGVFHRVNGECIERKGVASDVVLPSILNHFSKVKFR